MSCPVKVTGNENIQNRCKSVYFHRPKAKVFLRLINYNPTAEMNFSRYLSVCVHPMPSYMLKIMVSH